MNSMTEAINEARELPGFDSEEWASWLRRPFNLPAAEFPAYFRSAAEVHQEEAVGLTSEAEALANQASTREELAVVQALLNGATLRRAAATVCVHFARFYTDNPDHR